MSSQSKNDIAWSSLFGKYDILKQISSKGIFTIASEQINEFREARLMTKFDHSFQLPKLFVQENLSILPISRGEYIIAPIDTFCRFEDNYTLNVVDIERPQHIESLDYDNITSEAMAINCAYVSGIIRDFTEDEELMPTVSGRMSSQTFDFTISSSNGAKEERLKVGVSNSQIEIDGGYEGLNSLNLIEAKNSISKDFLVRQLYYPYRLWNGKVIKSVRTLFLTYTNGIFYLREYKFEDANFYNSLRLVKEKKYRIKDTASIVVNLQTIEELVAKTAIIDEPTTVPFPQADSFARVINLCEIINSEKDKVISKEDLGSNYDFTDKDSFDGRQIDYYTNAAIYLELISKINSRDDNIFYVLTKNGRTLFDLHMQLRQLKFAEIILKHKVFRKTLDLYLKKAEVPSKAEVVPIMKESNLYNIKSDSTFERRASTVISWINWVVGLIEE
ncbi:MAG: transcriptional regulator [Alistipes sp.]